jgi:hypothetical protein
VQIIGGGHPVWTLDWSRATYRSAYVAFAHFDGTGSNSFPPKALRRVAAGIAKDCRSIQAVQACLFPLVAIGSYYTANDKMVPAEFLTPSLQRVLTFQEIQSGLQAGYQRHYLPYVFDVDAETNAITALICRADGMRPAGACGRAIIRSLDKGLK